MVMMPREKSSSMSTAVASWQFPEFSAIIPRVSTSRETLCLRHRRLAPSVIRRGGLPAAKQGEVVKEKASAEHVTEAVFMRLTTFPLTELAFDDPGRFDAALNAASRRVLPDFRGGDSTLRVLAKE